MKKLGLEHRKPYPLDEKDRKIIRTLFEDGRLSIADIAKRTQLRRDSVAYRLKKLQKEKVITGFVPILNPPSLGLPEIAILLIKLRSTKEEDKEKFKKKLVANKYNIHISYLIGKFDVYSVIVYENTTHLNNIIKEIREYVPNLVEDFEVYQIAEEPKIEQMGGLI